MATLSLPPLFPFSCLVIYTLHFSSSSFIWVVLLHSTILGLDLRRLNGSGIFKLRRMKRGWWNIQRRMVEKRRRMKYAKPETTFRIDPAGARRGMYAPKCDDGGLIFLTLFPRYRGIVRIVQHLTTAFLIFSTRKKKVTCYLFRKCFNTPCFFFSFLLHLFITLFRRKHLVACCLNKSVSR